MGQFFDYLTSRFSSASSTIQKKAANHVTLAESPFSQALGRGANQKQAERLDSLRQSNRKTIFTYQFITFVAFLLHFSLVLWPKTQLDSFSVYEPEGWQFITLNMVPFAVQLVAVHAMADLNRPIPEGATLTDKHSALELDQNDFISSLKVVIFLGALTQMAALYSDMLVWSVVFILPLWCCQLTSRLARSEFERHAPNAKKSSWARLNATKSPKASTPKSDKSAQQQNNAKDDDPAKATPRTRTKRAVKSFLNNASDKYHSLVAQQISSLQNMSSPLRSKKMIAYSEQS